MKYNTEPVRGMRDFFPNEMLEREWLFSIWDEVSKNFNFKKYDAPIVENLELLKRKAGEEISQQLYIFKDKSDRELALRGEMTPSLARMIVSIQSTLSYPIKWYSIAQCFRYERMTKGRKREHYQWNADILGIDSEIAEAEIILLIVEALKRMGLTANDVIIKISSRKIFEELLKLLNIPDKLFFPIMMIFDKKDKISENIFIESLNNLKIEKENIKLLYKIFEYNSIDALINFFDNLKNENNIIYDKSCLEEIKNLFNYLSHIKEFIKFDISIVRGLSYYTGIVFEVFYKGEKTRAIAGGGRYDHLLEVAGGKPLTGVGVGFGDVVIMDVLKNCNKIPAVKEELDFYIIPFSNNELTESIKISSLLRENFYKVDIEMNSNKKVKASIKTAIKKNTKNIIFLFPDELKKNQVKLKKIKTQEERIIDLNDFINNIIKFVN